ncbi:MAG: phage head closure protein [Methanomassiliicoccales archaeon]|jgi:SPP1 family predicted phage head-tail adaptor
MRAGELGKRITIQSPTRTSDGAGGWSVVWGTFSTMCASIEPVSGREPYSAQQLQGHVSHKVRIRYLAGVTHGMRVLYGTRTFDIQAVIDEDEKGVSMLLYCQEQL